MSEQAKEQPTIMRVKQPEIKGVVVDTRYHKQAKQLEHLLRYVDAEGNACDRWFLDSQLEVVTLPEGNGEQS